MGTPTSTWLIAHFHKVAILNKSAILLVFLAREFQMAFGQVRSYAAASKRSEALTPSRIAALGCIRPLLTRGTITCKSGSGRSSAVCPSSDSILN